MLRVILVLVAMFIAQVSLAGECNPERLSIKGDWGQAAFNVDIADTPELRARGLMHVEDMPMQHGMLFVFPQPQVAIFWMRNTLIPLDMIFAAEDGTVRHIHHNAIPHDETPIPGGSDIKFVFEINGGMSEMLGLKAGDLLRHPSIDQALAAWPCGSLEQKQD